MGSDTNNQSRGKEASASGCKVDRPNLLRNTKKTKHTKNLFEGIDKFPKQDPQREALHLELLFLTRNLQMQEQKAWLRGREAEQSFQQSLEKTSALNDWSPNLNHLHLQLDLDLPLA